MCAESRLIAIVLLRYKACLHLNPACYGRATACPFSALLEDMHL